MAQSKVLGVSWRDDHVYFIETANNSPKHALTIDLPKKTRTKATMAADLLNPTLENLEEQLRKSQISLRLINIALPTKEIIFRSFVIPFMAQHEIKGVIEFEVSKYVPFALEELNYAYTTVPIQEENIKRIRVVFVAIKKTSLSQYTREFELSSYEVNWIEPEPVTMVRTLVHHKIIKNKETIAVVEQGARSGRIIVVWNNLPLFVRDFSLITIGDSKDKDSQHKRLINEIRISLDYFNRQDNIPIHELLLLSSSSLNNLDIPLSEVLDIPSRVVNPASILGSNDYNRVGYLNAYGAAIVEADKDFIHFDLTHTHADANYSKTSIIQSVKNDIKPVLITVILCATLITGLWFFLSQSLSEPSKKLSALNTELGILKDSDSETLSTKTDSILRKSKNLKKIRFDSEIPQLTEILPQLLPEGTWLDSFNINYTDPSASNIQDEITSSVKSEQAKKKNPTLGNNKLILNITGQTYSEDQNNQLRLIRKFLDNIKNNDIFMKNFENISLDSTASLNYKKFPITSFRIICD